MGEEREEFSETVKKGYVIRQTMKAGGIAPTGTSIGLVISKGSEEPTTIEPESYTTTYSFALEDLYDEQGNPITEGPVLVLLNGVQQVVDEAHSDVSKWTGDYTISLTSETKGKATIELYVNGKVVKEDTVRFK